MDESILRLLAIDEAGDPIDGVLVASDSGTSWCPSCNAREAAVTLDLRRIPRDTNPFQAMAMSRVLFEWNDSEVEALMPPLTSIDLIGMYAKTLRIPIIPGATVLLQCHFRDGPLGACGCFVAMQNGVPLSYGFGFVAHPDVMIQTSYEMAIDYFTGTVDSPDIQETGRVRGSADALSLIAGLLLSDEYLRVSASIKGIARLFANLGKFDFDESLRRFRS